MTRSNNYFEGYWNFLRSNAEVLNWNMILSCLGASVHLVQRSDWSCVEKHSDWNYLSLTVYEFPLGTSPVRRRSW